jgi:hypothetical protein
MPKEKPEYSVAAACATAEHFASCVERGPLDDKGHDRLKQLTYGISYFMELGCTPTSALGAALRLLTYSAPTEEPTNARENLSNNLR